MADVAVHTSITERVAVLTLSHPARRNALNIALSALLAEAVQAAADDPEWARSSSLVRTRRSARVATSRSSPPRAPPSSRPSTPGSSRSPSARCRPIAAVNGAAVGAGLNLALATDLRLAGPRASFDSRFLQLGLHPGGGYTWMAQRVLGPQGAAAMTLFGEAVDAAEAERIGLVHRVVDDVVGAAVEMAARAAAASRELVVATKGTMRLTAGHGGAGRGRRGRGAGPGRVGAVGRVQVAAGGAPGPHQPITVKRTFSRAEPRPVRSGGAKRHSERARVNLARSTCTRPEE
jgi:Enoyl-CoA hydratase/carnithine racemase